MRDQEARAKEETHEERDQDEGKEARVKEGRWEEPRSSNNRPGSMIGNITGSLILEVSSTSIAITATITATAI